MMSHRNIVSTIAGVTASVPKLSTKDVYLAYLPLAHVLELAGEVVELSNFFLLSKSIYSNHLELQFSINIM
jgi:long-subunit acyl-CoA synthetase (AMP-forming)